MKIVLTEAQVWLTAEALEWAKNPQFGDNDQFNKAYDRIIKKLEKGVEEQNRRKERRK